jgi:penicillin-binding protein 2B
MKKRTINNVKISNVALIIVLFLFLILIFRASELALSKKIDGIDLQKLADSRTTEKNIIKANRGTIYDVKNQVLAQNVSSYKIIAYLDPKRTINENKPQHVVDKEKTASLLAPILGMEEKEILALLSKTDVYQTEFGTKGNGLTEITKDKIVSLNLPGIDFIETKKRNYPYGRFLSYTLGYAKNNDKDVLVGELGLESYYNDILSGTDGYKVYQKDLNGYKIPNTKEITKDKEDGQNIYLTIDSNIQFFVEQALSNSKDKYGYESMSLIVASAKTGAILAMATNPSFDPNIRDITNYLDPITQVSFEPGSTMKIYTYMAAIENGVYNGSDTYMSGSFTTKDNTVISDFNKVGWGRITYDRGFLMSSNTAVVNIMDKYMDASTFKSYLKALGFGSKTGITLSKEATGKIAFKYQTEVFNAAFGQGIMTTPIQHIQALTAIANDGNILKPYIVSKIVNPNTNEVTYEGKRTVVNKVASTKTVDYIKELMYQAVNDPTAVAATYKIPGYEIIGKTGTAQIASTNGKGYLTGANDTIRSVAIMFPKDNPEIIIYAATKRPQSGLNSIMVPVKEVIQNVAKYLNVFQETEEIKEKNTYKLISFLNEDVEKTKNTLIANNIVPIILGNGIKIIDQYPKKDTIVNAHDKVFLITNDSSYVMPNIIGWSIKEVRNLVGFLKIPYQANGNGYVTSQSINPGTVITNESFLNIELKN